MLKFLPLLLLSATPSFADWEGDLAVRLPRANKEVSGKIRAKGSKQRMDMTSPIAISTIIDLKAGKALSLIHSQKMVMETPLDENASQFPSCDTANVEKCFKDRGYRKTGSEKANGHPCAIYEGTEGKTKIKLWKPTDLKEVAAVKTLASDEVGLLAESNVTNVKIAAQADSQFVAPKGYQAMGNMQDLMKGMGDMKMPGSGK